MANAIFDFSDDRFVRGIIRRKVRQLIGLAGFTHQDRDDLEQELYVRLLQAMRRFDPERAHRNAFVTAVIERFVANVLRNKRAQKRNDQGRVSLNVFIEVAGEGQTELAQTIGDRELDARLGRERRSEDSLRDLMLDMAAVIATLPRQWQTLLELRKKHSMTEAAEQMGVPRTTLNEWMRRIRRRFEDAGMEHYLVP